MQSYLLINTALQLARKWETCEEVLQELQYSGEVSLLFHPSTKYTHFPLYEGSTFNFFFSYALLVPQL